MEKKRTAIVTGGGSGLGRALSIALGKQGYLVILIDIAEEALQETARAVTETGGEVRTLVLDISQSDAVSQEFEKLIAEIIQLNLLINCAGFSITSACENLSYSDWQRIIQVNLLGTIQLATLALQKMKKQSFGSIVNIASMFGLFPAPSGIAYATTKHGVVGFTRTLAVEAKEYGIVVSLVCPGFIQTSFFENAQYIGVQKNTMMGKLPSNLTSPQEAAQIILRGSSRGKALIIFPFYVRLLWWIDWLFPWISAHIWQSEIKKYREIEVRRSE